MKSKNHGNRKHWGCAVLGCSATHQAHGLCMKHYTRRRERAARQAAILHAARIEAAVQAAMAERFGVRIRPVVHHETCACAACVEKVTHHATCSCHSCQVKRGAA